MKYSVGYQLFDENENSFAQSLVEMAQHIDEVYFPWVDAKTCRSSLIDKKGLIYWDGQKLLEQDLKLLSENGIKLNLLLNANCYGEDATSTYFRNYIYSLVDHIANIAGRVDCVTTTSPFAAKIIKQYFPQVKTRASVNMRIGTLEGIQYLAEYFDGFYI